jgi:Xaa-Pro aminopeptidase
MAFTEDEKQARHRAIQKILETNHLQALLLMGDTNVGYGFYGDLRYYTNNRTIFYRQVVVAFPQSESVLLAGTDIQRQAASRRSFVVDCRLIGDNLVADVANLLKEHGISSGKVGVNMEMLPAAWYEYLKEELPRIEWVETHEQIMQIRLNRSQEEWEIYRRGAVLGDGGFEAALEIIRPGVSEYEVAAEIEHFARARGAEEHFTLIASGKFSFSEDNTLPLPCAPSHRQIELGDSIVMEITPRYDGYWTQLVRTVNVGKVNSDLNEIQKVCCNAIEEGLKKFKPGKAVKDVVLAMESYVANRGYSLRPPIGHICGVDLIEARVSKDNEITFEPGTAVIIHPTVFTPDGKNRFFWGETYLVTYDGYERLHQSSSQLLTV